MKKRRVAIIGSGSMGCAIAEILAIGGHTTVVWSDDSFIADAINNVHKHPLVYKDRILSRNLLATDNMEEAVRGAEVVIVAVSSVKFRVVAARVARYCTDTQLLVSAAKGLEPDSCLRMSTILEELTGSQKVAAFSGPNLPADFLNNRPTGLVIASHSDYVSDAIADLFDIDPFVTTVCSDIAGVEFAGAFKNVYAIAIAMAKTVGLGDSFTSLLFSYGIEEMQKVGAAAGADAQTFMTMAAIGDLYLTSTSEVTGNYRVGQKLGEGAPLFQIVESFPEIPEGVNSVATCLQLAKRINIAVPLVKGVHAVMYDQVPVVTMFQQFLEQYRGNKYLRKKSQIGETI